VSERVVNQLLTEMDGLDARRQVFVIAATNRPDIIDPAMLRPGRLDKLLFVPLPNKDARCDILKVATRKTPISKEVNLAAIASRKEASRFSGADITALVREATTNALRRARIDRSTRDENKKTTEYSSIHVTDNDFDVAFTKVFPSVSPGEQLRYESLQTKLRGRPSK